MKVMNFRRASGFALDASLFLPVRCRPLLALANRKMLPMNKRPMAPYRWIPASPDSAATIAAIAVQVHPGHPERETVFANRLALYSAGCLLLVDDGSRNILGYVLAHPWKRDHSIMLDQIIEKLPIWPDCFYLHDIALLPETRGRGMGYAGIAAIEKIAHNERLPSISLVALSGALPFWTRNGFQPTGKPVSPDYGPDARYLSKPL